MTELDHTDRRILRVLQRRGRISNAELAEEVSLSASACHRRLARLEETGTIAGYAAHLDRAALGLGSNVFVEVTLAAQTEEALEAFEAAVARIPEILECHLMAGSADYLLKIVVADTEDFARLHRKHLACLPSVARLQSSFVLKKVRETTELPV